MAVRACAISSLLSETSTTLREARAALMSAWIQGGAATSSAAAADISAGARVVPCPRPELFSVQLAALLSSWYWQS